MVNVCIYLKKPIYIHRDRREQSAEGGARVMDGKKEEDRKDIQKGRWGV